MMSPSKKEALFATLMWIGLLWIFTALGYKAGSYHAETKCIIHKITQPFSGIHHGPVSF